MKVNNHYQLTGKATMPTNNVMDINIGITGDDCAVYMGKIVTAIEGLGITFTQKTSKEIKNEENDV